MKISFQEFSILFLKIGYSVGLVDISSREVGNQISEILSFCQHHGVWGLGLLCASEDESPGSVLDAEGLLFLEV